MSGTPKYKVFDSHGTYQAACKDYAAAAALMGLYGDGATIRTGHAKRDIVWTEGEETQPAYESYDHVAEVASDREFRKNVTAMRKSYGDSWVAEALEKQGLDSARINDLMTS